MVFGGINWKNWRTVSEKVIRSVIFEAEVAGTDEIEFWVMSWRSQALILEPRSLREEIRAEAEATIEGYEKGVERKKKTGP